MMLFACMNDWYRLVATMRSTPMLSPDQGQCWVLADNEELQPPAVLDSRTFGPLDLSSIIGRWIIVVIGICLWWN